MLAAISPQSIRRNPVYVRERIAGVIIPRGGSVTTGMAVTEQHTEGGGVNVTVKATRAPVDVSVGGTYTASDTEGTTVTTNQTFNYDDSVGGNSQYLYAVYRVDEEETLTQYAISGIGAIGEETLLSQHSVTVERTHVDYEQLSSNEVNRDGEPPMDDDYYGEDEDPYHDDDVGFTDETGDSWGTMDEEPASRAGPCHGRRPVKALTMPACLAADRYQALAAPAGRSEPRTGTGIATRP